MKSKHLEVMDGPPLERWQDVHSDWERCKRCQLSRTREHVCFARGTIPASVVMVGEAPGDSENVLGVPFIGPAGDMFNRIMDAVGDNLEEDQVPFPSWAVFNILGCVPIDDFGEQPRKPLANEVKACRPRLLAMIRIANPDLIVTLGDIAKRNLPTVRELDLGRDIPVRHIVHPSAIVRTKSPQQAALKYKRAVRRLTDAFKLEVPPVVQHRCQHCDTVIDAGERFCPRHKHPRPVRKGKSRV